MPIEHVVQEGECIASIAFEHGHVPDTIWNDPANEPLRKLREDGYVLEPGDTLTIPDLRPHAVALATGKVHRFRRKSVPEKVTVILQDVDGKPRSGLAYIAEIAGARQKGTTGDDGALTVWIPPNAMRGTLHVENEAPLALELGALNPIATDRGVRERLAHLGFLPAIDSPDEELARALAYAALAVRGADGATTGAGYASRATAVTYSFNQAISRMVRRAVRNAAAPHPELATDMVGLPAMYVGRSPAVPLGNAVVEAETLAAATHAPEGFTASALNAADGAIVSRVARAAYAAAGAAAMGETVAAEADLLLPVLAIRTTDVNTVMGLAADAAWTNDLAGAARLAAYYAMIGEAERRSGVAGAAIQAAVEAVNRNTVVAAADAAAVNFGNGPSIIAYSYGIMPPSQHCYMNASSLGGLGHPHPLAIAEYLARGWTTRRNTSMRANHGARQTDPASPMGHASIEWNVAMGADAAFGAGAPVTIGPCPSCGQRIDVNR